MAALNQPEPAPPAEPPDGLARERALDAKLAKFAQDKAEREAAKPAAGQLTGLGAITERLLSLVPKETSRDKIVRVGADEGDRPEIPANVRASIVPQRFTPATFANYSPKTRQQSAARNAAQFWLERALAGECCMLALIGPQGTGKSHLLYAAANALLAAGRKCYGRPWYTLADELRYGGESPFVPGRALQAHEVRAQLWKQRIVLLDEVRPTASTAFDDTELAKFSCHAYDAKLAVFLTTNVHPLADVMGPPAASRYTQVLIDGPDARQA